MRNKETGESRGGWREEEEAEDIRGPYPRGSRMQKGQKPVSARGRGTQPHSEEHWGGSGWGGGRGAAQTGAPQAT